MGADDTDQVSREAVLWAFRCFIGREPVDEQEISLHQQHPSFESLRAAFVGTREFATYLRSHQATNSFKAPLFLLGPPADQALPWRFEPPLLAAPVSQMCTGSQMEEATFIRWCEAMQVVPAAHRKIWEFCFVLATLDSNGMLRSGMRGLGFGVGQEPLPAVLAKLGLFVTATDAPIDIQAPAGWASTGQHSASLEALYRPKILPDEEFARRVEFRFVDMNAIPEDLQAYDFCWSSCALEHLGSLEHGLRFIEESLRPLRPGGWAVHTTEFNLSSPEATIEAPDLSLYRRKDFESVASRLAAAGHQVQPLNFHPGDLAVDEHIDLPPYALPHLKLMVAEYVTTSFGFAVRKAW